MKTLFLLVSALISSLSAAQAWDYTGHMLVDQIAYENVSPRVRTQVDQLVSLLENKHNEHKPYTFITAGAWLDDMRAESNYPWGALHYIDVAYSPSGFPYVEPPPPHALSALEEARTILRNKQEATDSQRSEALGKLMHLVGDLHQPLHCVDWDDRGGNGYFIYGIPFSDLGKKTIPNLHSFWDKSFRFDAPSDHIVELYHGLWPSDRPATADAGLIHDEAAKIMTSFPKNTLGPLKPNEPGEWAQESHTIACLFAYPLRPHPTDAEVVALTPDYVHHAHEIACSRIALAGYRLATILEDLFKK